MIIRKSKNRLRGTMLFLSPLVLLGLLEGATELKVYGKHVPIKAKVHHLESLSAHADQSELLTWMGAVKNIPEKVFLVHGELSSMEAYRDKIHEKYGWHCHIPKIYEVFEVIL